MSEPLAYAEGRFVPRRELALPLDDVGFIWGATVSERLRTYRGQAFRIRAHLARLARSAEILGLALPLGLDELGEIVARLAAHNAPLAGAESELDLTVLVTPGSAAAWARGPGEVRLWAFSQPLDQARWQSAEHKGVRLLISPVQQVPPECWPAELKCRSRMHYFLAQVQARASDPGAQPVLLDRLGHVSETPLANVLAVQGASVVSPPREAILPGVSLGVVRELCPSLGLAWDERPLVVSELRRADEVWLTGTPFGVLAATALDGQPLGSGRPGPRWLRLRAAWDELVARECSGRVL